MALELLFHALVESILYKHGHIDFHSHNFIYVDTRKSPFYACPPLTQGF